MAKINVEQTITDLTAQSKADSEAVQALIDKFLMDVEAILSPYINSELSFPQMSEQRDVYDSVNMKREQAKMRANMTIRAMPPIEA